MNKKILFQSAITLLCYIVLMWIYFIPDSMRYSQAVIEYKYQAWYEWYGRFSVTVLCLTSVLYIHIKAGELYEYLRK